MDGQSGFLYALAGALASLIGGSLIFVGVHDGSVLAAASGYLAASIGCALLLVAIIAKGVELGLRAAGGQE